MQVFYCLFIYIPVLSLEIQLSRGGGVVIIFTGLTLPHFGTCPRGRDWISNVYVVVFYLCSVN